MNKSKAQIFLERVGKIDRIIENKLIEQRQWRDLATRISANISDIKVQSSGCKDKMAEAIDKCIDMESEIAHYVDELIAEKREVVKTLEEVYSPTEYNLLHMRYIQYMRLEDIASVFKKDYGWATTTHGRALKSLERILE